MDSWMIEHHNLCDLGARILSKLNEREQKIRSGMNVQRLTEDTRSMLSAYSKSLIALKGSLAKASVSYHITQREYERRQRLVDDLSSKQKMYENTLHSINQSAISSPWSDKESDDTRHMDAHALRQEQQRILAEQDEGLEALSGALRRQKKMGQAIGEEIEYQTGIIDNLGGETDRVDMRIQRETHRIEKVTRKSGSCVLWCVAVILFIMIVVFMAIPRQ